MTWEAGWRYGIISTVAYEHQKIYRQIILFQRIYYLSISLTGLPCHRERSIVLMSMVICYKGLQESCTKQKSISHSNDIKSTLKRTSYHQIEEINRLNSQYF